MSNTVAKYHNTNGELPVNPLPTPPLVSEFIEGLEWGGVPGGDLNAPFYKRKIVIILQYAQHGRRKSENNLIYFSYRRRQLVHSKEWTKDQCI